jgi:hypothetical protein
MDSKNEKGRTMKKSILILSTLAALVLTDAAYALDELYPTDPNITITEIAVLNPSASSISPRHPAISPSKRDPESPDAVVYRVIDPKAGAVCYATVTAAGVTLSCASGGENH